MAGSSVLRACALCLLQATLSSGLGMVQVPRGEEEPAADAPVVATPETSEEEPGQPDVAGVAGGRSALAEFPVPEEYDRMDAAFNQLRRAQQATQLIAACQEMGQAVLANHMLARDALRNYLKDMLVLKLSMFATNPHVAVNCIGTMVDTVAYNWELSSTQTSFIPFVAQAIERHGAEMPKLIVHAAMLQDNSYKVRKQMKNQHVPWTLYQLKKKEPSPEVERAIQCFVSSYCGPQPLTDHLVELNYIPLAMQAMRDFANVTGIRGLILNNINSCFIQEKVFMNQLLKEGIVAQVLSVVQDQLDGVGQMEEMGPMPLYSTALNIMKALAVYDENARSEFLQNGVMKNIDRMVTAANSAGGETLIPSSTMPRTCRTSRNLGHPPNLASRTCAVLKALKTGGTEATAPPNLLKGLEQMFTHKRELLRYDQPSIYECAEFGLHISEEEEGQM